MVRIIDGEIVADDDPRVKNRQQQQQRPAPGGSSTQPYRGGPAAGAAGAGGAPAFVDWSKPAFQVLPKEGGLPDTAIYGVTVPGIGFVALAAAGFFGGWRAAAFVGIIGFLYCRSQQETSSVGGGSERSIRGGGLGQQVSGAFAAAQQSLGMAGSSQQQGSGGRAAAAGQQGSGGPFQGKSYKLSNS